jgi:excisionase family DNA binding protein
MQEMYTPEELANLLKISRRTVYLWLREGRIKGIKVGDLWRIPKESLGEFLEEGAKTADKDQ